MVIRVLKVGLLAGLLTGLLIALLQQVATTPLILKAEAYEASSEATPAAPPAAHHAAGHEHGDGWKPQDGLERFFFTALATVATAVGVSLLLLAVMILAGVPIDRERAIAWAVAGFVATGLAPAAGLAPLLPGSAAGDLAGRQIWWIGTALATAVALGLMVKWPRPVVLIGAVALIALPHIVGAPPPHALESRVPAELAARFAALSLIVQGLLWVLAGAAIGHLWPRMAARPLP